jgi:hypothetical protein
VAIQYPGGTIVNTTFVGTDRATTGTALETQLVNAGWTVISGSGTNDRLLESATTPTAANLIRVRIRTANLTNCVCINMQNVAATKVSQNYFILPAALKTFRIIANKYQFFVFTPGTSAAREFVACGVPWIPTFLHGVMTDDLGWISGNGLSDTSTTVQVSFRTSLHCAGSNLGYSSGIVNGSLFDFAGSGIGGPGGMRLVTQVGGNVQDTNAFRWHDDSLQLVDPLIAWGLTSAVSDEAKIRGQLWGAVIVTDAFAADTTLASVDGHSWLGITNANGGSTSAARGTLFLATS